MRSLFNTRREPLIVLVSIGLAIGLFITALSWVFPASTKSLFSGAAWFWTLTLIGTLLTLTGTRLAQEQRYPAVPKPVLILAVVAATALVYLFPELFAPGCGGMPRAFAACPAACRITTCSNWDAPGENGCDAKPPHKGCCVSYETICDPACSEPDDPPPPPPVYPPSISGSVSCAVFGSNGWCLAGAAINMSASDPQGNATTISGDIAGAGFSCAGPNCSQGLPGGSGAIHFQATATSGLSSGVGSASFAFDPTTPSAALVISGTAASNGWYTLASVSTSGSDPTSGIASTQVAVDGGSWQTSSTLAEGIHSIIGRAIDNAGNATVTPAQTVKVDATPPSISSSITFGTWVAGWYVTDVTLSASASDATSGLALIEYRLDGGTWSPGSSLTVASEGTHNVDFRATDQAGLRSTTSISFKVDKTPPSVTFTPSGTFGANGWYISPVSLLVNAVDALSGVAFIENRLDGGSWTTGNSLLLSDGEHTVEARATDNAGNLSAVSLAETIGLQVDTTAPSLATALTGTIGLADWYVSDVTVTATVFDATSGIALTEYQVDGGGWEPGTIITVSADGPHTVDFRTTDTAGNRTTDTKSFKIDQTRPVSAFVSPLEGSKGTLAIGTFTLDGKSTDASSGLAAVEISVDEGLTWLALQPSLIGEWHYTWNTKPLRNGLYPVLARAHDIAGNVESTAHVTLLLANHPPKVIIQESWWIWEAGSLDVRGRFLPVTEIRVRIGCLDGQPDVKLNFTPETMPSELSWDRKCGEGQFATAGDHPVTLTACDWVGNCASATGTIKVPFIAPAVPTWTPTAEPEPTSTQEPKPRVTTQPTVQAFVTALPVVAPSLTPIPAAPAAEPAWLAWLLAILLAGLLALAIAAVLDPRPRALRRLGKTLSRLASDEQA